MVLYLAMCVRMVSAKNLLDRKPWKLRSGTEHQLRTFDNTRGVARPRPSAMVSALKDVTLGARSYLAGSARPRRGLDTGAPSWPTS